jgi:hypothetical protein
MSRVMELVTQDSLEVTAQRAYEAYRRVGKVLEYDPAGHVEGKIYIDGYPALLTVEWKTHRDGQRVQLDVSATSNDELSRAADGALYRYLGAFKKVTPEELAELPKRRARNRAFAVVGLVAFGAVGAVVAHFLGWAPFH